MEYKVDIGLNSGVQIRSEYDKDKNRVFGFLVRMTGEREIAEDLLQDTFLAAKQTPKIWTAPPGRMTSRSRSSMPSIPELPPA